MKKIITLFIISIFLFSPLFNLTVLAISSSTIMNVDDSSYSLAEDLFEMEPLFNKVGVSLTTFSKLYFSDPSGGNKFVEENSVPTRVFFEKTTVQHSAIKSLTLERHGKNATDLDYLHTYLLFFVDINPVDISLGKVGKYIDNDSYYTNYTTDEDDKAYSKFINTVTGKKQIEKLKAIGSVANLAMNTSHSILESTILAGKLTLIENIRTINDIREGSINALKDIKEYYEKANERNTVEGFIKNVNNMIDSNTNYSTPEKKALEELNFNVFKIGLGIVKSGSSFGSFRADEIIEAYNIYRWAVIEDFYDKVAFADLSYTRSTRLILREYNSWGMY